MPYLLRTPPHYCITTETIHLRPPNSTLPLALPAHFLLSSTDDLDQTLKEYSTDVLHWPCTHFTFSSNPDHASSPSTKTFDSLLMIERSFINAQTPAKTKKARATLSKIWQYETGRRLREKEKDSALERTTGQKVRDGLKKAKRMMLGTGEYDWEDWKRFEAETTGEVIVYGRKKVWVDGERVRWDELGNLGLNPETEVMEVDISRNGRKEADNREQKSEGRDTC